MEIERASFPEPWPRVYFEKLYQRYPKGFIIAKNGDKIIGYTIGRSKNDSAEIISLAVDPPWRKKGIGTALSNFLINHFKEKEVKEILLHVRTENKEGISFYKNLGFNILKTIKDYYPNGDNAYLLRKEI